nr:hypothetical protein [Accumulibacter sp.]
MHRGLADVLDDGKNVLAFLIANGIAEQAAKQADVVLAARGDPCR